MTPPTSGTPSTPPCASCVPIQTGDLKGNYKDGDGNVIDPQGNIIQYGYGKDTNDNTYDKGEGSAKTDGSGGSNGGEEPAVDRGL